MHKEHPHNIIVMIKHLKCDLIFTSNAFELLRSFYPTSFFLLELCMCGEEGEGGEG
jgi:hypothetical protein